MSEALALFSWAHRWCYAEDFHENFVVVIIALRAAFECISPSNGDDLTKSEVQAIVWGVKSIMLKLFLEVSVFGGGARCRVRHRVSSLNFWHAQSVDLDFRDWMGQILSTSWYLCKEDGWMDG